MPAVEGAKPLKAVRPLPRIRVREVAGRGTVANGDTLMLAGPVSYDSVKMVDKISGLGDIPVVGRLFTSEHTSLVKKHLIVLVTPTLANEP